MFKRLHQRTEKQPNAHSDAYSAKPECEGSGLRWVANEQYGCHQKCGCDSGRGEATEPALPRIGNLLFCGSNDLFYGGTFSKPVCNTGINRANGPVAVDHRERNVGGSESMGPSRGSATV